MIIGMNFLVLAAVEAAATVMVMMMNHPHHHLVPIKTIFGNDIVVAAAVDNNNGRRRDKDGKDLIMIVIHDHIVQVLVQILVLYGICSLEVLLEADTKRALQQRMYSM